MRSSAASKEATPPSKRKKGKASDKGAPDIDPSVVKAEVDNDPIRHHDEPQDSGVANLNIVPVTLDSSSEDGQESDQKESSQEVAVERLETVKAALQSRIQRTSNTNASVNLREENGKVSSTPTQPTGGGNSIRETIIASLALTEKSQQLLIYHDQMKFGRLPGDGVITHGKRCAIELKILLHRRGHRLQIYQDGVEVRDSTNLKDPDDRTVRRVQEEPLPASSFPSTVMYQVNQSMIGNMLLNDPGVLCYGMYDGPHALPFVSTNDEHSILVINLEGGTRAIKSNRGSPVGHVRETLGLKSGTSLSGIRGCCRHFKDIGPGAFCAPGHHPNPNCKR